MLSIITELSKVASTQSDIMDFNSYCQIDGKYVAASSTGYYEINSGVQGDGSNINAYLKPIQTDFGYLNMKRIRCLYIAGEFTGDMEVEVTADERITKKYLMSPLYSKLEQHGFKVPLSRNIVGGWWSFKFSNINGADFSIDAVYANVMVLGRKPRISPA